jgi:serine/threonine-protein kinase
MTAYARVGGILNPGISLAGGEYQITKPLGQGGFGITYQGIDTKLNRPVAVKEFFPEGCWRQGTTVISAGRWNRDTYSDAKQQFLQEGQTLGQFNHPGIVRVFYYFEENNTAYMVMEYLQGQTLGKLLKLRGGKLPEAEALTYIEKVGRALEVLHRARCLHRDIKPENIMLTAKGRVVLIDFGAARDFTSKNSARFTMMLTPGYAPLEQYGQALRYGAFTDIYALGATFYHILTGQIPVSAVERAAGVELKTANELNPQISPHISEAIRQAMAMNVSDRLQSVKEFLDLLLIKTPKLKLISNRPKFYSSFKDPWSAFNHSQASQKSNSRLDNNPWF